MLTFALTVAGIWGLIRLIREFRPAPTPRIYRKALDDRTEVVIVECRDQIWVGPFTKSDDRENMPEWYRNFRRN